MKTCRTKTQKIEKQQYTYRRLVCCCCVHPNTQSEDRRARINASQRFPRHPTEIRRVRQALPDLRHVGANSSSSVSRAGTACTTWAEHDARPPRRASKRRPEKKPQRWQHHQPGQEHCQHQHQRQTSHSPGANSPASAYGRDRNNPRPADHRRCSQPLWCCSYLLCFFGAGGGPPQRHGDEALQAAAGGHGGSVGRGRRVRRGSHGVQAGGLRGLPARQGEGSPGAEVCVLLVP